ncbi:MAG: polymorphic toxin-type HINT domain-containing protein [Thermoguttaceae bacterium]
MELPGAWDVRTVTPTLPDVNTFGLVTDDGDNSSDGQSSVLTLEGALSGIGKEYCEVEFFCGNLSLGSAWTDETGAFEFEPTGLPVVNGVASGTVTAKAVYRPAQGNPVYGAAASQTITYIPPVSDSTLTVSLVHPLASNSNATSFPEISVISRFDDDKLVRYEFQWGISEDGEDPETWSYAETVAASTVDGSEILNTIQQQSTFRLQYLSDDLTGTSNDISLRVRSLVYDTVLADYRVDSVDWTTLDFTYVKPAYLTGGGNQNTGPFTLTILTPTDNGTATDLTLGGTVTSDTEDVSYLAVSVYSIVGGTPTLLGITETDEDGCFEFRPTGLTAGNVTLRAEYTYYDVNEHEYVDVSDTVSFTYTTPTVSAGVISQFALLDDTGTAGDSITSHADLIGRLADDGGNLYRVVIEIDTDGDGTVDDYTYTDEYGEFLYRYTPAASGDETVQARAVRWDAFSEGTVTGGWKSLRFTYNAPPSADLPVFTQFGPASAVEGANDILVASSPVVTGAVSAPCSFADVSVEVMLSGGTAVPLTLNGRGEFCWLPDLITTGNETTVTVQGRLGKTVSGTTVWGDWTTITFIYRITPESEILYYDLVLDTEAEEENTYTFSGQLVRATDAESVYLEIDSYGDEQADLRLYANSEGYFSGTVTIDRPTVRVRVVDRSNIGIDTPTQDGWNALTVAGSTIAVENTRLTVAYENGGAVVRIVGHQGGGTNVSVRFDVDSDGTPDFSLTPNSMGEIDSATVLSGLRNYLITHSELKSSGLVLLSAWIGELNAETQTVIVPVVVADGLSVDQLSDVTSQYDDFAAAWGSYDHAQQTATAAQTPITVQSTEETAQAIRPGSLFNPDDWNILLSTPIPDIVSPTIFGETPDLENSEMLAADLEDENRIFQNQIANARKVYITSYETLIQKYNDALDRAWNEYSAAYDRLQNRFDEVQARTWESTEIPRKLGSEYTAALRNAACITCEADYFKALYLAFEHYQSALATAKHRWEIDQANELQSIAQEMAGLKKTYEDACSDAIDILKGDGSATGIGAVNSNYCNSVVSAWYRATMRTQGAIRYELNAWKNAEGTETEWANYILALNQYGYAEEANVIVSYYDYCMASANAQKSSISTELNALKSYESSNALSSYNYEIANIDATADFQIASADAELSYLLNVYSRIKWVGYDQIDRSHAAQQTILQAESDHSEGQLTDDQLKSIAINSTKQMYLGVINSGEHLLLSIIQGRSNCERSVYDSYGVYLKAVAAAEVAQDYARATADYTLTAAYNGAEQSARTASESALQTYLQYSLALSEANRAQEYSDLFDRVSDELPGWFQSTISAYGNLGSAAGDLYESIYSLISSSSATDLTAGEDLNDSLVSQEADYAESILDMNLTFNSAVSAAVDQYNETVNAVPTQGSTTLSYAQIDAEIRYYKNLETAHGSEAQANVASIYQYYRNKLQCNVLVAEYGNYDGAKQSIIHSTYSFNDGMFFTIYKEFYSANITDYINGLNIVEAPSLLTTQIHDLSGRYYPNESPTAYFAGIPIPSYSQLGITQDQYSALVNSPLDLLRAEFIQASFARHAAEADAELAFLNAYGTSARTEIVNSFSEIRSDLTAQIAAGRTLNNSLWSLAQTANGTYTAAIQDNASSADIRAYLESSDNRDIDFEADLEEALGDFQLNWRQERLSGMQQTDPYYTEFSEDLTYITQTNAVRASYNSAMALKSKALNSAYYTALNAYESSLLTASITQSNAILDAAETQDKGRYNAEAAYYDTVLDAQEDWTLAQFDALLEEMTNNATAEKAIYESYARGCAAALNSVAPIYGNGTDLLAYFSVHSNPYTAIVADFSGSVKTAITGAHSANATVREDADEASQLAYEVADNAAYAAYVAALAQLDAAYQTAVSAANAAYNTAADTAETVYTATVTPALHQYEQDYEYLTSLYSQAVKIIEDGGTVSATYLTDDTISFTVCFVAGTPVLMADGTVKPIEEIQPGDTILATDHLNPGEAETAEVVRVFENGLKQVVRLVFDRHAVVCTPEHPFFVLGKGWRTASELESGDQCVSADGEKILFEKREELPEPRRVYNFEVEGKHTYYVGSSLTDSVLVHNVCASCGASDCPGPKKGWHPYRWLMTGDIHACDNLMNASLEAAGQVIQEKAPERREWTETLSFVDPTPFSDVLVSFFYYAEGEDEKAITTLKVSVFGLGVGGTGSMHLAGSNGARLTSAVKQVTDRSVRSVSTIEQDLVKIFGEKQKINSKKIRSSVDQYFPCEGQNHHIIPKIPAQAVEGFCPKIANPIKSAYRKLTTRALTLSDHCGYQGWHRKLDGLLSELIAAKGDKLTGRGFVKLLKDVYSHSELLKKFPNAIQDIERWAQKYGIYDL